MAQQLGVKALLESGMSERMASKKSGVSRETVRAIKNCKTLDLEAVDRIKKGLAAKFYDVADRSLDNITDSKLERAQPSQLIMTAGIATDKARLIEGKATTRTEYVNATDQAIQTEIEALEAELVELNVTPEIQGSPALEIASNSDSLDTQAIQSLETPKAHKEPALELEANHLSPENYE